MINTLSAHSYVLEPGTLDQIYIVVIPRLLSTSHRHHHHGCKSKSCLALYDMSKFSPWSLLVRSRNQQLPFSFLYIKNEKHRRSQSPDENKSVVVFTQPPRDELFSLLGKTDGRKESVCPCLYYEGPEPTYPIWVSEILLSPQCLLLVSLYFTAAASKQQQQQQQQLNYPYLLIHSFHSECLYRKSRSGHCILRT
jgi:hypothetical protein